MWKPPTSSCSASTRSNGGRFSSAVPAMMKMKNGTMPVIQRFHRSPYWPATIWLVESIPPTSRTVAMESPRAASYETICAEARTEPRSGYFEPDDQPASTMP